MNLGLSDKLKAAFPSVVPVDRPVISNQEISDPMWLAGFTSAEGCFKIKIFEASTKIGETVKLEFNVAQHIRDEQLIKSLIKYFGCGNINQGRKKNPDGSKTFFWLNYLVTKFNDIQNKIIPFF